jgi:uncharacterized protein YbcV (DUF1398 family)
MPIRPALAVDHDLLLLKSTAIRRSRFPEFIAAIWAPGVWHYEVDLDDRTCAYVGLDGDEYLESYGIASEVDGPAPAG